MYCRHLLITVNNLQNVCKSFGNIRQVKNFSGLNTLSSSIKNDQARKNSMVHSRNVFSQSTTKKPVTPEKKEVSRKQSALSVMFKSRSKPISLADEVGNATSSQENSKFCSICNLARCKLLDASENKSNSQLDKSSSNTISIIVDKKEFCRTMCNSSGSTSSTQNSEYCVACDLPKCRLTMLPEKDKKPLNDNIAKSAVNSSEISSEDTRAKEASNDDVDKGAKYCSVCQAAKCKLEAKLDEGPIKDKNDDASGKTNDNYCDICKTAKCQLLENESGNPNKSKDENKLSNSNIASRASKRKREENLSRHHNKSEQNLSRHHKNSKEQNKNMDSNIASVDKIPRNVTRDSKKLTNTKSSDLIEVVIDRNEICQICQTKAEGPTVAKTSETNLESKDDIKKIPTYCAACKLPKCKYVAGSSEMMENVRSPSSMSNSADSITIMVDKSQICSLLCKDVTDPEKVSSTESADKTPMKSNEYCDICNAEICRLTARTTNSSNKSKSQERTNFNSNYRNDNCHCH